ncbi:hypothetical protein [Magnetococcus sp. PR-3]|uniref:hypothetical protein n=1 Tax=Magnetococcus sp. PR-3 TaxID=3120355 RepID=UPI002FCDEA06
MAKQEVLSTGVTVKQGKSTLTITKDQAKQVKQLLEAKRVADQAKLDLDDAKQQLEATFGGQLAVGKPITITMKAQGRVQLKLAEEVKLPRQRKPSDEEPQGYNPRLELIAVLGQDLFPKMVETKQSTDYKPSKDLLKIAFGHDAPPKGVKVADLQKHLVLSRTVSITPQPCKEV